MYTVELIDFIEYFLFLTATVQTDQVDKKFSNCNSGETHVFVLKNSSRTLLLSSIFRANTFFSNFKNSFYCNL